MLKHRHISYSWCGLGFCVWVSATSKRFPAFFFIHENIPQCACRPVYVGYNHLPITHLDPFSDSRTYTYYFCNHTLMIQELKRNIALLLLCIMYSSLFFSNRHFHMRFPIPCYTQRRLSHLSCTKREIRNTKKKTFGAVWSFKIRFIGYRPTCYVLN